MVLPGEEKKDARGLKVVPTVEDEDGEAAEIIGSEGMDKEEPQFTDDQAEDNEGEQDAGESTIVDGNSTIVTNVSMVTDRSQLAGTISGLSSGQRRLAWSCL